VRFKRLLFLLFTLVCVSCSAGNTFAIKTVVIDAGHGGKDPGASGPGKTNEKDVALAVALKLGADIQKNYPDVNVIYTRKTDVFIELHERAEIANKNKADLFIAIHCNSSTSPTVYGTSTYVLGLHRTEANLEVAKRENSVILLENDRDKNYEFDPNSSEGNIIMSLRQNAFLDQSIDIASKIEAQYETSAKRKSLGVKQAGFYVIYKTAMPSLLSEIGFISNPNEEKFLVSEKGQEQIANSIFKAFKDYKFEMENSEGEQFAYQEAKKKAEAADTATKTVKPKSASTPHEEHTQPVKESQPDENVVTEKPTSNSPTTEKPAVTPAPAPQSDPDNITVTLLSGRKIKKPIDNASGGGVSPDAVKPSESAATKPAATAPDKKNNSSPDGDSGQGKPAPVTEHKEPAPPVATEPVDETPPAKKVTAGNSGGATIAPENTVKPVTKPVVEETVPVKTEAEPVKEEEKIVAETKPVKTETKPVASNAKPVKTEAEPVKEEEKPVVATKPVKTEAKPVATEKKPVKEESKPVKTENRTVAETKPAKTEPKPVAESKPAKTTTKPVEKEPVTRTHVEKPVIAEKPVKKAPETESVSKPVAKPAVADNSGKMTFKVQLIALKGAMKSSETTKVTKLLGAISNETIPSGLIRYYSGNSKTYAEAKRKIEIAVEAGYKDAFIVGFKDGVRYGPEKLKAYQNQ